MSRVITIFGLICLLQRQSVYQISIGESVFSCYFLILLLALHRRKLVVMTPVSLLSWQKEMNRKKRNWSNGVGGMRYRNTPASTCFICLKLMVVEVFGSGAAESGPFSSSSVKSAFSLPLYIFWPSFSFLHQNLVSKKYLHCYIICQNCDRVWSLPFL